MGKLFLKHNLGFFNKNSPGVSAPGRIHRGEVMKCRKCHAEIPDESKYCLHCGAKQELVRREKARGNGQGSARKRGNTWSAVWTVGYYVSEDGKKHQLRREKGGFRTKRDALAYAADPGLDAKKVPTLRSYWTEWERAELPYMSGTKQTAYRIAWKKLSALADIEMGKLDIGTLQGCIDAKAKTYYPARDMKTVLSHLFKRAVAEGNARTNLSDFIRLPKLEEKELQPFTEEELRKMWVAYGNGDRFIGFALLMVYTGMMPGELFKLKIDMIDWENNEIRGCGLKTKKRKETPIVFPEMISPVLSDLAESSTSKAGYVLGMNKDNFYKQYHAAIVRAGVRDLDPYSCRHTTATALALGNIAPSVIQEVMRHTKFTTTQRYIHPDTKAAHDAINTMGKG